MYLNVYHQECIEHESKLWVLKEYRATQMEVSFDHLEPR